MIYEVIKINGIERQWVWFEDEDYKFLNEIGEEFKLNMRKQRR